MRFINFKYINPTHVTGSYTVRRAVYLPLADTSIPKDIPSASYRINKLWRHRLYQFKEYGWQQLTDSMFSSCFNCCPCGVYTQPVTRCCRYAYLCPWCYARQVQYMQRCLVQAIDNINPIYLPDVHLAGHISISIYEPKGATLRSALGNYITAARKRQAKLLEAVSPYGAYTSCTLEPLAKDRWKLVERNLLLCLSKPDLPAYHDRFQTCIYKNRVIAQPNKAAIAKLLAWTFRYPKRLLTGDPKRVVDYLQARANKRLSGSYGCMRSLQPFVQNLYTPSLD